MGLLTNAIKKIDKTKQASEEVKTQLRLLNDLAEERAENMRNLMEKDIRTSGEVENKKIPIDVITRFTKEIHVYHSQTAKIGDTVKNVASGFVGEGGFLSGVAGLLDGLLNTILGTGFGSSIERKNYFIIPSAYGMTRIDTYIWVYNVSSASLAEICQNIIVAVNFESVVDLTKISLPSFMQIYSHQLYKMGMDSAAQKTELERAEKVYRRLNPNLITSAGTDVSTLPGDTTV